MPLHHPELNFPNSTLWVAVRVVDNLGWKLDVWLLTLRQKTAFPLLLYNTTQEVDGFTTSANEPLSTFSQSTF